MDDQVAKSVSLLFKREHGIISRDKLQERFVRRAFTSVNFEPIQEIPSRAAINQIDVDPSRKYAVTSDSEGNASFYEIKDESQGKLELIERQQYVPLTLHKCQWYPSDNGMLCATYPTKIVLIDTNTFRAIDTFDFGPKKIYGSDWNSINPHLIAVGASLSSIRFVDIRTGSDVQQIVVESHLVTGEHNVSRVLWSAIDEECLFAGDSAGFIHVFDIRKPRKSLQTVGNDVTFCEPVVSLNLASDSTNIIAAHGISNRLTRWVFKDRHLVNSDINYAPPLAKTNKKRVTMPNIASSFLKCQIYVTDSLIFKPIPRGLIGLSASGEIIVYDAKNGERLRCLNPSTWNPDNFINVNCVTGLHPENPILLSGSRRFLRVWGTSFKKDGPKNDLHVDDWSD